MQNFEKAFYIPADWENQSAVWFSWPSEGKGLWNDSFERVREQLIELYAICAAFQNVTVLCSNSEHPILTNLLKKKKTNFKITLLEYETDDVWIRDYGPIFLKGRHKDELIGTSWNFNAWGGKFKNYQKDNAAADWICQQLGIRCIHYHEILEGGAIETNGSGILCTTKSVLCNTNRLDLNGSEDWDSIFQKRFDMNKVLWFENGLVGDDTDGHIDNLLRFTPDNRILFSSTNDIRHNNYSTLQQLKKDLEGYLEGALRGYSIAPLPIPAPLYFKDQVLAASYINYLVLNNAVIVPCYNQKTDDQACLIIQEAYPDYSIVPFQCTEIIQEGGGLHCLSLNQPSLQG